MDNQDKLHHSIRFSTQSFMQILAGAFMFLGLGAGPAQAGVIDPTQPVAGISQLTLSEQWWQWALSIPADKNPIIDADGAFAHVNNDGPIFFIAGNFGGVSNRAFDVPAGKPVFFPILNTYDLEIPGLDPSLGFDCFTTADPLSCALNFLSGAGLDNASNLHATLDGQNLLTFPSFRQTSNAFYVFALPVDNLYSSLGIALHPPPDYLVSDGYWVALDGLPLGRHTLVFSGKSGSGFELEVTANLNVIPEPGTLSLMLLGAVAALSRRRGK